MSLLTPQIRPESTPPVTATIESAADSGWWLVLRLARVAAPSERQVAVDNSRGRRAARWALELDAQVGDLVAMGKTVRIAIPPQQTAIGTRPLRETVGAYRALRLRTGPLLLPLFRDEPSLESLYPFQREGTQWLTQRSGAILADDMGLGKTVQAISAMRLLFHTGNIRHALVVCPRGLIAVWEDELGRWAPELSAAVMTPAARIRNAAWAAVVGRRHVLITNYEHLRELPQALKKTPPDLVVADEAHRLRNRESRTTSGGAALAPKAFWALSGTPLERNLNDFATLLSLVAPAAFAPSDGRLHPSSIRSRARNYMLRRRKRDVLKQLPSVLDTTETLELTARQQVEYRRAISLHARSGMPGEELALLTHLLALCDLEPHSRQSSKIDRILDLLPGIKRHDEKAVVFSYRLDPLREVLRRVTQLWNSHAVTILVGSMNETERKVAVDRFRTDPKTSLLLASSRVGGEGLTLVEANHVFLLNQWWNPSANDQARDRVVRIGQRRKVRVYRFCCRATVEDGLARILQEKRALFAEAVDRLANDGSRELPALLGDAHVREILAESDVPV